ncbi:cystathionine beta-lyase [Campylobacter sp. MIT 12-8780]|uniref:MalY/PatB family protein n=1 Tax=unclassified Campylobacter TaxID=2593542 RepID=UPI00115EB414|nr:MULTISPECIES: PatB family C-S lyase [unclassified Campylobacter]NDJ27119.1 putative C-S lyase [Campylobacter sp. MIT 19-121]TQR41583.1 cystathionine beta-lyase [Campylobacter sp. MIT 12-8780]
MPFKKQAERINSLKWNVKENELALWVADMDFKAPKALRKALLARVKNGVFGYEVIPQAFYESFIKWWQRRHGVSFKKEHCLFVSGVVPALSSLIRSFSKENEGILVLSPVYGVFFSSIINNGRKAIECELVYKNYTYSIDFKDLQIKLKDENTKIMILCNPHNPIGKIYTEAELKKIIKLCEKYEVLLISDEIHCDLTSKPYTPIARLNQKAITLISASKAFNLAGMHAACMLCADEKLRTRALQGFSKDEINEANSFACLATITAFNECEVWLDKLNIFINKAKEFTTQFLESKTKLKVVQSEATYMLWLDCSALLKKEENSKDLHEFLQEKVGLILSCGSEFKGNGAKFLRINLATTRKTLKKALKRLELGLELWETR